MAMSEKAETGCLIYTSCLERAGQFYAKQLAQERIQGWPCVSLLSLSILISSERLIVVESKRGLYSEQAAYDAYFFTCKFTKIYMSATVKARFRNTNTSGGHGGADVRDFELRG